MHNPKVTLLNVFSKIRLDGKLFFVLEFCLVCPQVIVQFQPSAMPDEWGTTQDGQTRPRVVKRGVDDDQDEVPDGKCIFSASKFSDFILPNEVICSALSHFEVPQISKCFKTQTVKQPSTSKLLGIV